MTGIITINYMSLWHNGSGTIMILIESIIEEFKTLEKPVPKVLTRALHSDNGHLFLDEDFLLDPEVDEPDAFEKFADVFFSFFEKTLLSSDTWDLNWSPKTLIYLAQLQLLISHDPRIRKNDYRKIVISDLSREFTLETGAFEFIVSSAIAFQYEITTDEYQVFAEVLSAQIKNDAIQLTKQQFVCFKFALDYIKESVFTVEHDREFQYQNRHFQWIIPLVDPHIIAMQELIQTIQSEK